VDRFTPVFAPIPLKNTQLGWGLGVMAGAIHRFDADTTVKPSTGVIGGFYTENDSWGLLAVEMARLAHDSWRLRGLASHCDINYDFFGIGEDAGNAGRSIPLNQTLDFGVAAVLRRVSTGFYLGGALMAMSTKVELQSGGAPGVPLPPGDSPRATLVAPGIQGELDTRDDDYWPTRGSLAKLKGWFFTDGLGSTRNFQRYMGGWTWYTHLPTRRLVIAGNANLSAASGDVPFYALPSVGAGEYAFRGYEQGRLPRQGHAVRAGGGPLAFERPRGRHGVRGLRPGRAVGGRSFERARPPRRRHRRALPDDAAVPDAPAARLRLGTERGPSLLRGGGGFLATTPALMPVASTCADARFRRRRRAEPHAVKPQAARSGRRRDRVVERAFRLRVDAADEPVDDVDGERAVLLGVAPRHRGAEPLHLGIGEDRGVRLLDRPAVRLRHLPQLALAPEQRQGGVEQDLVVERRAVAGG
jgi:hypothetical protein